MIDVGCMEWWASLESKCSVPMASTGDKNFLFFCYINLYRKKGQIMFFCIVLFNSYDVLLQNNKIRSE